MRRKLRSRYLLPGLVVVGVAFAGLFTSIGAGAQDTSTSTTTTTTPVQAPGSQLPIAGNQAISSTAATANDPIRYTTPPSSDIPAGRVLFETNCASCHGNDAYGTARAPNLVGLGAATVDFWVSTGRMPLAISSVQALRKPVRFSRSEIDDIVAYVTSLTPAGQKNGPAIPTVDLKSTSISQGNTLFVLNCAACHTITGAGDALAEGFFAPSLHKATKTQIAEAIRTGPGNMPRFGPGTLTDKQVADIVRYVTGSIQHPDNRGGLGLGGIGPVAEGFVALLIGVGGMMLIAYWIGDRA